MGGRVFNFDVDEDTQRTQHYEWLVPVYFRLRDNPSAEVKTLYLEARTTTVKKTLQANVNELDFGEVPVAFKSTKEILVKNIGTVPETIKLQSLTPFGGFCVLNAMRTIMPGESKAIVV